MTIPAFEVADPAAVGPQNGPILKSRAGGYIVKRKNRSPVVRPNRLAAGMEAAYDRSGRVPEDPDVLKLLVRGTTDSLHGKMFLTNRAVCPCCGSKTNLLRLNDSGRLRLAMLRRRRSARLAAAQ